MPPVSFSDVSSEARLVVSGLEVDASWPMFVMIGLLLVSAGPPTSAAAPSDWKAGMPACEKGPSSLMKRLIDGASAPRSVSTGVIWSASPPRLLHRRLELAQEGRQLGDVLLEVAGALRGGLRRDVGLRDEVGDLGPVAGQRSEDRVAVARQVGEHAVLVGEDGEDLVGLLERRVGVGDRLAQVAAAPGQAGAQLVEDDGQPLAVGQAQRVVEQVEVDRLGRLADRQQVLPLAGAAAGSCAAAAASCAFSGRGWVGRALHELLADQRLRADRALRVGAEVVEAGAVDAQHHRGLVVGRDVERLDLADLDAGDLDVLAGDDREGVHEDRPHAVAAARRCSRPCRRRPARRRRGARRPWRGCASRAGEHEARVAVQGAVDVAEGRRAVDRRLGGRARAALDLAGLQARRAAGWAGSA